MPIQENSALSLLRERVEEYLEEGFGHFHTDEDGDYNLLHESARVFLCPRTWTDTRTVLRIFSITNVDVPASADLLVWLAGENFHLTFGHFAHKEKDRSVWFIHNLLGDFLDKEELLTAVRMVASQANDYDDRIKEKFGGRLFTEGGPARR
jgi:hypothetical protein